MVAHLPRLVGWAWRTTGIYRIVILYCHKRLVGAEGFCEHSLFTLHAFVYPACPCLPLYALVYPYMPLLTTICPCLPLHALVCPACPCLSLHALVYPACPCLPSMPLFTPIYPCMPIHTLRTPCENTTSTALPSWYSTFTERGYPVNFRIDFSPRLFPILMVPDRNLVKM